MLRPKFIPKNQRGAAAAGGSASKQSATATAQADEEARAAAEDARRRAEADALVEEQIKKDLDARASGRKHWEDEGDAGSGASDVDTTDGLDPDAEEAAWRLRELRRVKRERDRIAEQEAEIAERERRDNLTQEERDAEDAAKMARQQDERDARGKMGYLQKYYHKGAFLADEMAAAGLDRRDLMGARIADDVKDRSALPEYLQRRDMTLLGRKGATKYKDLKSEDTGRWGEFRDHRPDRFGGARYDDVDERFRPDGEGGGDRGAHGANLVPLGERRRERPREDRRRSRSRSASPRRQRDDREWRKRSPSRDRDGEDKRRRVDAS
ncbi:splicing factor, Prp19-binding domain-containing protein [Plectosphaerella plurivora]|uniref:Splicing factor, Prp19-binding domain-containing protein n=1 Tax=Plectosphaerella plurivora TaxID=936078 RepID=A0A9P9A6R1_9PEZI|nr:splicing factor, Prp19-binding domain-containing protein [Plectosphaerella plurivora]